MEALLKLIGGLLLCALKFGMAYLPTIRLNGYNFVEAVLFGLAAGFIGNVAFIYAGDYLNRLINKTVDWIRGKRPRKARKVFSKSKRRLVRIKSRYGLIGIALMSPLLIGIPVGAFIAVRYFHNKKKILLYMMASVLVWSLVFSTINLLF